MNKHTPKHIEDFTGHWKDCGVLEHLADLDEVYAINPLWPMEMAKEILYLRLAKNRHGEAIDHFKEFVRTYEANETVSLTALLQIARAAIAATSKGPEYKPCPDPENCDKDHNECSHGCLDGEHHDGCECPCCMDFYRGLKS